MKIMKLLLLTMIFSALLNTGSVNAQTGEIFYYPKLIKVDAISAKTTLVGLIKGTSWGKPDGVSVFDNRIELTFKGKKRTITKETISFSDMASYPVGITRVGVTPAIKKINATITYFSYVIHLKNCNIWAKDVYNYFFYRDDLPAPLITIADTYSKQNVPETESNYIKLADYLYFFAHPFIVKHYDSLFVQFKTIAEQYRALQVKPTVSEEQRKYIVQANSFNQEKNYSKAIELYNKALELEQTAYPAAYSNLALLSAQTQNYEGAIFHMKKYLLLVPDANDARSAQDKIYEWEAKTSQ
jgi:tetratricopeptide (TPR) repeat protein